jgi:hypothetical protein
MRSAEAPAASRLLGLLGRCVDMTRCEKCSEGLCITVDKFTLILELLALHRFVGSHSFTRPLRDYQAVEPPSLTLSHFHF